MSKAPVTTIHSDYFPNAMAAIAEHAVYGNEKHNPGERLHWAFYKSTDHANCVGRHLAQRGKVDPETGKSHTIAMAIRALMLLETELIEAGATPGRAVDMAKPEDLPKSVHYEIEDIRPRLGWSSMFDGVTFDTAEHAQNAILKRVAKEYLSDFVVREVS